MDQEKIGKFILKLRKEKNMTQQELADKLNVTDRAVSHWENGRSIPDVSLFKQICEIFDISVNELISGQKLNKEKLIKKSDENIINTISDGNKQKRKSKRTIILLIIAIIILLVVLLLSFSRKYPKIDLYHFSIQPNPTTKLNKKTNIDNQNIYYYGIDYALVCDSKENCYQMSEALKHNQISLKDFINYLEKQVEYENYKSIVMWDGGTKIYKKSGIEIIKCNTLDGNRDIYIGNDKMDIELKGNYCGHNGNNQKNFTRTYYIISAIEDNDENYIDVTLRQFQGDPEIVKIDKSANIVVGKNYEFTFLTYTKFDDTIKNIFENSTLLKIEETNKTGLSQVNEEININDNSECCDGCLCGDTLELIKNAETAWTLTEVNKKGEYIYDHNSFINFNGNGQNKFAFFKNAKNGKQLSKVTGTISITRNAEIVLIPDNSKKEITCKIGEEKNFIAVLECDNNLGTFTLQKQGTLELPSIIKNTIINTKKIVIKDNKTKTITDEKKINAFISIVNNSKVWTGPTTLPSVMYEMELFDSNKKSIAKVEYTPGHYFTIKINDKNYNLTNFDRDSLNAIIEK